MNRLGLLALGFVFLTHTLFADGCLDCLKRLRANPNFHLLEQYGAIEKLYHDGEDIRVYQPTQGILAEHDASGNITRATIRVLTDNPQSRIEVTGEFNDWGRAFPNPVLQVDPRDNAYHFGEVPGLRDGMQYRLLENGQPRIDPAAIQTTTPAWLDRFHPGQTPYLNSIYVDLDKLPPEQGIDLSGHIHRLSEQALQNLIAKWHYKGQVGPPSRAETYKWFAESGIAEEIAKGNNALELMPQQGYIDGDQWQNQYQVFGRGPDSRFGTPAEFKAAVRALHKAGVAVILDIVPSHYPYQGNGGVRELHEVGLHQWQSRWGRSLYGWTPSPWGTNRYDFSNPYVRRYLVDNTLVMFKHFDIDGIRVDNVDGIRSLPGGWDFLRELNQAVRAFRPHAFINDEAFSDYKPLQQRADWGGQGADTSNGGDFFWQIVAPYIRGRTEDINMDAIRDAIRKPYDWGTAMQTRYLTNHDESGNSGGNFSGGFPADLLKGGGDFYTYSKIKVWNTLAATIGAHSMDMLQVQLGQEGNMNVNPQVDWELLNRPGNRQLRDYFVRFHQVVKDNPAFAPENLDPNIENHIDRDNKVISLVRTDFQTGKKTLVVMNLGHRLLTPSGGYRIGVNADANFRVALDSDWRDFGGSGAFGDKIPWGYLHTDAAGAHEKSHSLILPVLAPYEVLVLQEE